MLVEFNPYLVPPHSQWEGYYNVEAVVLIQQYTGLANTASTIHPSDVFKTSSKFCCNFIERISNIINNPELLCETHFWCEYFVNISNLHDPASCQIQRHVNMTKKYHSTFLLFSVSPQILWPITQYDDIHWVLWSNTAIYGGSRSKPVLCLPGTLQSNTTF